MATTTQSKPDPDLVIGTLALRTLSGDIRDRMLGLARGWTKPFDDLSHDEQQQVIETVTSVGERTARESLTVVHGRSLPTLGMKVVSAQRKGKTMRVTLEANYTKPGWLGFGDCEEIVAVQASPEQYFGERRPLHARPDQTDLDLENTDDAEVINAGDQAAEGQQNHELNDGALGPEAIRNGEMLEGGIQPLDAAGDQDAQTLQEAAMNEASAGDGGSTIGSTAAANADDEVIESGDPAAGTKKRGGRRTTTEERVAARQAATAQDPPPKRTRRSRETLSA